MSEHGIEAAVLYCASSWPLRITPESRILIFIALPFLIGRGYSNPEDDFTNERDLLTAIFRAATERGTDGTGVFGLRLQRKSAEFYMEMLSVLCKRGTLSSDVEQIQSFFGITLFIHLSRRNQLNQAISLSKANQTGIWHKALDGTELNRTAIQQEPVYDARVIARHLSELTDMDTHWNLWFLDQALEPLRISYEELSAGPAEVLSEILGHLVVDQKYADGIALPVAKLADQTNKRWEKRFLYERT